LALPSPYGQSGQYDQNGWSGQDGQDGHYDFFGEAHPGNGAGSSGQTDPHLALDPPASASYRELGDDVGPEPYLPPQPYRQREPSADNGSYGPADGYGSTGSGAGPDALNGHRAFGSDSLGRASSFGPADSFGPAGSFGPADAVGQAGSFDPASSYGPASSYDQVGSDDPAYGTFGRPGSDVDGGPSGRRGRQDARSAGRGQSPASAGYSAWHDDREDSSDSEGHGDDDDWDDDSSSGSGLLSRFGRGGGGKIGRGRGRGGRPRRLRGKVALVASVLAVALVLGVLTSYGYDRIHSFINNRYGDYAGPGTGTVLVVVPPGANLISLAPILVKDGVIMSQRPFISAANAASNSSSLQPGTYKLHYHMNAALACSLLLNPKSRTNAQVTIIEGLRASNIALLLHQKTGIPTNQFLQIIEHPPAALGLPKWAGKTAEGFLFPDTYILLPHQKALAILQMMVAEFNQKVASLNLVSAAAAVFTSPFHVLIVASMVQAEAGTVSDFGKIARVAWHRLSLNMPLDFDSTVFYGLNKYGTAATIAETHIDTPYNTYLHTGLPPGPIDSPGLLAIEAALHPPHGPWLYFIANGDHGHSTFFNTYAQMQQWERTHG